MNPYNISGIPDFQYIFNDINEIDEINYTYTGRHMHGYTCIAFYTDEPKKVLMLIGMKLSTEIMKYSISDQNISEKYIQLFECMSNNIKIDNLGKSFILYFPHVYSK